MELKWLEDFLVVAELGSFSRAAQVRNVTQPAFSRRIRALETWVGAPLIDRSAYPTSLTPAGVGFLKVAKDVVAMLHQGREMAGKEQRTGDIVVRIAMSNSLSPSFFPHWWTRIVGNMDPFRTHVAVHRLHDLVESLEQGHCHLAVCYKHAAIPTDLDSATFTGLRLGEDCLMPVCAPNSDGEPKYRLPGTPESRVPYLSYVPDDFLGRVNAEVLRGTGVPVHLKLASESSMIEALRTQCIEGRGIAWLSENLISDDLASGRLMPAGGPEWQTALEVWMYRSVAHRVPGIDMIWASVQCMITGDS